MHFNKIFVVLFLVMGAIYAFAGITNNKNIMSFMNRKAERNGWLDKPWYRIYCIVVGVIFIILAFV